MAQSIDREIREALERTKKIVVIGLSPVPARPSYGVTRYMIQVGYEIYGIRPGSPAEILGRPCFERLADLKEDVDLFDVFRNPEALPAVVDEIGIWLKHHPVRPRVLWLQEGVVHAEAEAKAKLLGLQVISDKCILKEHARLC